MEQHGIENDHRHGSQGDQRQGHIHAHHEDHGQHQQNQNAQQVGHLLGNEVAGGINIRGAALDDVAGTVLHMPAERQVLDVTKEGIAHGFHQRFGAHGIAQAESVLGNHLHQGHQRHGQGQNPQVLAQIGKAAHLVDQRHDPIRIGGVGVAHHVIHRHADNLRSEHIHQRSQRGGQHAHHKEALAALEEAPQKRCLSAQGNFFLIQLFILLHVYTLPFLAPLRSRS